MDHQRTLTSYNLPFLEALYEDFQRDPESVAPQWRALLEEAARPGNGAAAPGAAARRPIVTDAGAEQIDLQHRVERLVANHRLLGHIRAKVDPLERPRGYDTPALDLEYYGLSPEHMSRRFHAVDVFPDRDEGTLGEIVDHLQRTYCRHVGVEYFHMNRIEHRTWLRERMEASQNQVTPSETEQKRLFEIIARADNVDTFLHQKFIGAKRFSAAGAESVLAILATLIEASAGHGVEQVLMGMAHRGRLAVMLNVFEMSVAEVFSRFAGGDPMENLGRGDVKYHLGAHKHHFTQSGRDMYLALMFNPSHLEAITPVVAGRVRAGQDLLGDDDRKRVLGVTMHGDAAVMGQGVYAETLNLARLPGYTTGGTIRVILNNQVGFTTNPRESRSTVYCTAQADMLQPPIFHVNGHDPEAAAYVAKLAVEFRQTFGHDVIIDLCCYRKFGHNEGDEPTFTQPRMYERIGKTASVRKAYEAQLIERGTVDAAWVKALDERMRDEFEAALKEVRESPASTAPSPMHGVWQAYRGGPDAEVPKVDTGIDAATFDAIGKAVTTVPDGFKLHRKLQRFVKEQQQMAAGAAPASWAFAEMLAYGSLLREGACVRLSGQDSVRGTFTHRHSGWTDSETEERYFPLSSLEGGVGRFEVLNSPLSEFAVLGFEFGYTLAAPETLVIWEAQFGDFVNGAQVIIDQFISSSEDKWNRISGLVMLLPHGYEGQGPEHSSARLERFLQLCAEDNIQVCNFSTTAQLFHALRRQVRRVYRKPLIVMSPKSLLRTRASFSPREHFVEGSRFERVLGDDAAPPPEKVTRVLLCSGKVFYDLVASRGERDDVAIVRVEQLYPFPEPELDEILARYPRATELMWVQEEPANMGGWAFVRPRLEALAGGRFTPRYVGRDESASPATGSPESHKLEQDMIMNKALRATAEEAK